MKKLFLIFFCVVGLSGCAQVRQNIIASNENYLIVETNQEDNYASLAEKYMGNANNATIIQRYNPGVSIVKGSHIAIPLKNFNATGVFVDGYQRIPILCYHQFTESDSGSSMLLPQAAFEEQMTYLKENDYQVIALKDVYPFLEGKKALPDKSVVITVDDGYKSFFSIAYPILKKYGFESTVFIYPDFIGAGLALSWDQVNSLVKDPLVDIQSHSKSHTSLSPKPGGENKNKYLDRLKVEVEDSDRTITRKTGVPTKHFAYPYGNSSPELVKLLRENSYELALTVKKGGNASFAEPYLLRRTIIYGKDDLEEFKKRLDVYQKATLK